jgi:hypothetical protein
VSLGTATAAAEGAPRGGNGFGSRFGNTGDSASEEAARP